MIEVLDAIDSGIPLPQVDDDSRPFFAALARGELVLQWRARSGWCHYPRPAVLDAADDQAQWRPASGRGTVHTFTVVRQQGHSYFAAHVPYAVAIVRLSEGVDMMGTVTGLDPGDVRIGLEVQAYAMRLTDDIAVPFWRPCDHASEA